jgi:hypothetical protein
LPRLRALGAARSPQLPPARAIATPAFR